MVESYATYSAVMIFATKGDDVMKFAPHRRVLGGLLQHSAGMEMVRTLARTLGTREASRDA
jgi:hypothetical protein